MKDLISVIVPVFNTELYLSKCVESILAQSYRNLEIIIINDGSTDRSRDICLRFVQQDNRIVYLEHEQNRGLSSARNSGLNRASGQYISFIDSDDFIHETFIDMLYNACITNFVDVSVCGMILMSENGEENPVTVKALRKWSSKDAISRLLIWDELDGSVCDKLFKKELFDNLRFTSGRIAEDLPVTMNILCRVGNIVHTGNPLYFYFQRTSSISKQVFKLEKMSVLNSASEVRNMVMDLYPNLKNMADFYYNTHLIYLVDLLATSVDKNKFKSQYHCLKKQLIKALFSILSNEYFRSRKKIKAIILASGLLNVIMKVYKIDSSVA
jgi:glycosyltransferase involved in cell wall biosynthesis